MTRIRLHKTSYVGVLERYLCSNNVTKISMFEITKMLQVQIVSLHCMKPGPLCSLCNKTDHRLFLVMLTGESEIQFLLRRAHCISLGKCERNFVSRQTCTPNGRKLHRSQTISSQNWWFQPAVCIRPCMNRLMLELKLWHRSKTVTIQWWMKSP